MPSLGGRGRDPSDGQSLDSPEWAVLTQTYARSGIRARATTLVTTYGFHWSTSGNLRAPLAYAGWPRRCAVIMPATPRTITTSGVGHHQCSQKAPRSWLPSNPAPKTPSSTNPAPSTRPTRFTLRAYRALALASVRYKRYSVVPRVVDHVGFAVADYKRSKAFCERALAPLGMTLLMEFAGESAGFGRSERPSFFIEAHGKPVRGRLHIALRAESRAQVDAFHAASGREMVRVAVRRPLGRGVRLVVFSAARS
jgi:catechol 2,3-dioxygenase-like lactoylglutathione lyase family enzyme